MAAFTSATLSVRTSALDLSAFSKWLTPDSSRRSVAGNCLGASVGIDFWIGWLTSFSTGELDPTLLTFIASPREPGCQARMVTTNPATPSPWLPTFWLPSTQSSSTQLSPQLHAAKQFRKYT